MVIDNNIWIENFKNFSEKHGYDFKIIKSASVGYSADYITCTVIIKYRDKGIILSQGGNRGNSEVGVSFLSVEYKYENLEKLSLSINHRDLFDRLFAKKRIRIGDGRFDSLFTINCTNKVVAQQVFNEERVRNLFFANPLMIFNIQTENNVTTIKMKNMEERLYLPKEMQNISNDFVHIIDKILV